MAISSINFRPVSATSESHNTRTVKLDYNFPELEKNNESDIRESISDRIRKIQKFCKEKSGRKLQKNAEPIREAVLNLNPNHTMDDLKGLARELKKEFGISAFQIHIHRDEGRTPEELNYHAHMLFDWQDKEKGTMVRLGKADMSRMQTVVANFLQMERGELKTNSNRERLEPIEYKRQQEELRLKELQQQTAELEQKKMQLEVELRRLESEEKQLQENPPKNLESSLEAKKTGFFSGLFQKKESTSSQKKSLRERYLSLAQRLNSFLIPKAIDTERAKAEEMHKKMLQQLQELKQKNKAYFGRTKQSEGRDQDKGKSI